MIKTVIIDAQKSIREKIASLLSDQGDIKVLAHGKDGYDALKLIGSLKPDIAILDNNLEFIDGEEIPPLLRARSPSTAVVILTAKISDYQLYRAVFNEVAGFIHKEADMATLPWILKCISEGGYFISPSFASRVMHLLAMRNWNSIDVYLSGGEPRAIRTLAAGSTDRTLAKKSLESAKEKFLPREDPTGYLSKTELQILTCVGEGNTSNEIAQTLHLAVGTVRNYISAVMHKTGLQSRSQMVRYAFQYGLVPLGKR